MVLTATGKIQPHVQYPRISASEIALSCKSTNCVQTPTSVPPATTPQTVSTTVPSESNGTFAFPSGCQTTDTCVVLATYGQSPKNPKRAVISLEGRPAKSGEGFYLAVGLNSEAKQMVINCDLDTSHVFFKNNACI